MHPPATLVFDLDGTLTDPATGVARSINHALTAYGHAPIAEADISRYIGPPLDHSFQKITGNASAAHTAELVARYRERYAEVGYAENIVYDGIPAALQTLRAAGHVLGVCTSKRVDFAEQVLELFELRQHFVFVDGGEVGIHKDGQLAALLAAGAVAPTAVMIGDRAIDVQAGRHNALGTAGVLWGHGSEAELREAGADRLLAAVPELHQWTHED